MELYLLYGVVAVMGIVVLVVIRDRKALQNHAKQSEIEVMGTKLDTFLEALAPGDAPGDTPGMYVTREEHEVLSRRIELVHKDCLRYLQKGASTWRKVEERTGEDGEMSEEEARRLLEEETAGPQPVAVAPVGNGKRYTAAEIEAAVQRGDL